MVRIFELHQQNTDIANYQSRIIECKSFQDYLQNVDERSFSSEDKKHLEIYDKYVDNENNSVTFMFERKVHEGHWVEFTHFAQVIEAE